MIKVILADEQQPLEPPPREVVFNFRRRNSPNQSQAEQLFITAIEGRESEQFPLKIDGKTQVVTVRRRDWSKLGFSVEVID